MTSHPITDPASRRDEPVIPPHDADVPFEEMVLPAALRLLAGEHGGQVGVVLERAAQQLEDTDAGPLATDLLAHARAALQVAERMTPSVGLPERGSGSEAMMWTRAAREALAARKTADEPLEEGERAATAALVRSLRSTGDGLAKGIDRQVMLRGELERFLETLAGEFESADTPTAARVAGRIRRKLAEVQDAADGR